jgi:molybdopterin-guanine dinucleotide biosynthesis protein A
VSGRAATAAIVLAGGASSRFGADKLVAVLEGQPLLHHALRSVDEVAATIVVVLAPDAPTPSLPRLRSRLIVAHDLATHQGPLAGLAAGLAALPPGVERAVLVGGDMPSLVPAVLARLLGVLDDPAVAAATLESEPAASLPMAVRPSVVGPAAAALLAEGRRALRGVLARVPSTTLDAGVWRADDPDGATLRDVDTRRDLFNR